MKSRVLNLCITYKTYGVDQPITLRHRYTQVNKNCGEAINHPHHHTFETYLSFSLSVTRSSVPANFAYDSTSTSPAIKMPVLHDPLNTPTKNQMRAWIWAADSAKAQQAPYKEDISPTTDERSAEEFECHLETVDYVRHDFEDRTTLEERNGVGRNERGGEFLILVTDGKVTMGCSQSAGQLKGFRLEEKDVVG